MPSLSAVCTTLPTSAKYSLTLKMDAELFATALATTRREEIQRLEQKLEEHKSNISQAFLVEVRAEVGKIQETVQAMGGDNDEERNKALLDKLLPPVNSRWHGRTYCCDGTRRGILDKINSWVGAGHIQECAGNPGAQSASSRVFWLYGVAGCGKSTIAASVCEELESGRNLAGSFFCKRDEKERGDGVRLVWAIAYYLARSNGAYREHLLTILRDADALLDRNLETQANRILVKPLSELSHKESRHSAYIVVDALDECNDNGAVMRCLASVLVAARWLCLFVTSRDLPEIRKALTVLGEVKDKHDLFAIKAHEDIGVYLRSQLSRGARLADLRSDDDEKTVALLVDKAEGLFIWIHTAVEYIASRRDKQRALRIILDLKNSQGTQSALDKIYRRVLEDAAGSDNADDVILIRYTIGIILTTSANSTLTAHALYAFLPPDVSANLKTFEDILKWLSPVLVICDSGVRVYHTSFIDFLSQKSRCGDSFYMGQSELNTIMAAGCLEIMELGARRHQHPPTKTDKGEMSGLRFNICKLESSFLANSDVADLEERKCKYISTELLYSSTFWFGHLLKSGIFHSESRERENVTSMVEDLLCNARALFWLEIMSLSSNLSVARSALIEIGTNALVGHVHFISGQT